MSTDDARSSSTRRRLCFTRSEFVWTFMPASTLREQAGTRTRAPSSSTTQTLQTLTGVRLSSWHRVGVSIAMRLQASRIVEPSVTSTSRPSMLTPTSFLGSPTKTVSAMEHLQLGQTGSNRIRGRLTQAADRSVAHRLRDVAEEHHVGSRIAVAFARPSFQNLLLPRRADPARDALPARSVAEKTRDAQEDRFHFRRLIEDDDSAGPKRRADRAGPLEAQRNV